MLATGGSRPAECLFPTLKLLLLLWCLHNGVAAAFANTYQLRAGQFIMFYQDTLHRLVSVSFFLAALLTAAKPLTDRMLSIGLNQCCLL